MLSMNFKKKCKIRIGIGAGLAAAGILAVLLGFFGGNRFPDLFFEGRAMKEAAGFYQGMGFGLMAAGGITAIRNYRYLKHAVLGKKKAVAENDERNRLVGLKCWAYAGYSLFFLLYLGILIGGFISQTVMAVLLFVMGVYAVLLLLFRIVLSKTM